MVYPERRRDIPHNDGNGKADKKRVTERVRADQSARCTNRKRRTSETHFPSVALDEFRRKIVETTISSFPSGRSLTVLSSNGKKKTAVNSITRSRLLLQRNLVRARATISIIYSPYSMRFISPFSKTTINVPLSSYSLYIMRIYSYHLSLVVVSPAVASAEANF